MVVSLPFSEIYQSPCDMSQKVDELLFGEEAVIIDETEKFYQIKTDYNYYGWARKEAFSAAAYKPNCIVNVSFADLLFIGKNFFRPFLTLPKGARIKVDLSEGDEKYALAFLPDKRAYYIQKNHISFLNERVADETKLRRSISETAKSYRGVQYRWGGRTFGGVDCSGLCFNAYRFNGIDIWRDAVIERSKNLRKIEFEEAKESDLVFFKGHIALYLGNGEIIHASASEGRVVVEDIKENRKLQEIYICTGTAF